MQQLETKRHSKETYKVNLREQIACCEANYARLLKLMPRFDDQDTWHYETAIGEHSLSLSVHIVERAPYTTMLDIQQCTGVSEWCMPPQLKARLYHDVRMAEVTAWRDHRQLRVRYPYPNDAMYQQDEKAQVNRYLGECLMQVLAIGHLPLSENLAKRPQS